MFGRSTESEHFAALSPRSGNLFVHDRVARMGPSLVHPRLRLGGRQYHAGKKEEQTQTQNRFLARFLQLLHCSPRHFETVLRQFCTHAYWRGFIWAGHLTAAPGVAQAPTSVDVQSPSLIRPCQPPVAAGHGTGDGAWRSAGNAVLMRHAFLSCLSCETPRTPILDSCAAERREALPIRLPSANELTYK